MPNTVPTTSTKEALEDKLIRCKGRAWCDHAFFVGATTENAGQLAELEMLPGTPGIKIFMGSSTGSLLVADDDHLRNVLRSGKRRCPIHAEDEARNVERKALISEHPHPREHPFLRDAESARLATQRILSLSAETGRPVHVLHVSTRDELPLIEMAKRRGYGTTAEVTPQHLFFHAPDCYDRLGTHAQMNPPIRSIEHQRGLWRALHNGVFDVFGSDHAPHTIEEKAKPYPQSPSGMPGVQTMLPVLLNFVAEGKLTLLDIARMACENPASLYGIVGKGFLEEGFDADLVFVDPFHSWTVTAKDMLSKCGWTPYEGVTLKGKASHTMLRGEFVMRDGQIAGSPRGEPVRFDWK
jgi:dihydroorotase